MCRGQTSSIVVDRKIVIIILFLFFYNFFALTPYKQNASYST